MKKLIPLLFVTQSILISSLAFEIYSPAPESLKIGAKAPLQDIKMMDVSGDEFSFKDKMDDIGLLVIFSCNTCPFVVGKENSEGWQGRYNKLSQEAASLGIGMVLINSNEAKRDNEDSFDRMIQQARDNRYLMPYLLDNNHVMADAFGARTTPHVFLFDSKYKLVYKGAIDDNNDAASDVKEPWLLNAMVNLSNGDKIEPSETRNIGCSIKRIKKED